MDTIDKIKLHYTNLMRNGKYEKAQTLLLLIRIEQERLKHGHNSNR